MYKSIQHQARFLLSKLHAWSDDESLLLLTDSKSGEHWIRPNTGTLAGFSFLYRFGSYDTSIVGLKRDELLNDKIIPMMRYLVDTHITGSRKTSDGKPWGDAWQSAHWAHMLGRAGWWIWSDLPTDLQEGIRRVVKHEAQRFVDKTPPSQLQKDTKAEENAWNAQIFSVAILLMPNDSQRKKWEREFQKWAFSSFLRPADENSQVMIDGRPVSEQFYGANVYNDFTLENHGIVHPDYMTTFSLSMSCYIDYLMTQRQAPEALRFNAGGIYENLKWFSLPDGGFVYPSGQDWRLFRNSDWFFPHILMAVFDQDPDAWTLAKRSFMTQEKMQARSTSGQIYLDEEFFFASTQSDRIYSLSLAWLTLQLGPSIQDEYKERLGVRRLDTGNILLNRTSSAIHTFSWGAKIMAQAMANNLDRIVSPNQRNGIGLIRLKNQSTPLDVSIHSLNIENTEKEFDVQMQLNHGENQIRADLHYHSYSDGRWMMREALVALNDVEIEEIKTGLIGILNNPNWIYERGRREIWMDGEKSVIRAHSGQSLQARAKTIQIDRSFVIQGKSLMKAVYQSAIKPVRARTTDFLFLNSIENKRYRKGEKISEFEAIISIEPR
ncbi:MAG: hypothetical protein JXR73_17790 [Candidatus Omnitrophica bacterium]|nr:hypothetical protein [Candidatus Omnitrophota bacterium]